MIDTVVLTFPKGTYLADYSRFKAISKDQETERSNYYTLVQNPTRQELKYGNYKPRLTIANRINYTGLSQETLKVEFSASKLIYGNNVDELDETDFDKVVEQLHTILNTMGVKIFSHFLEVAQVSAVHYSKNIVLTDGTTPYHYTKMLAQANISKSLDMVRSDFRNEGHVVKYRANSYEVVLYDKIKDLRIANKSTKRAEDRTFTDQLGMFGIIQEQQPFEILRFEVRLNTRQKIRSILKKLKIDKQLTFVELFSEEISLKMLRYYLDEIDSYRPILLRYKMKTEREYLADIVANNPKIKPTKVLQLLGMKVAVDRYDMRELRQIFSKCTDRTWYRLVNDAKSIDLPIQTNDIDKINEQLDSYIPLRLENYKSRMIINDKYGT